MKTTRLTLADEQRLRQVQRDKQVRDWRTTRTEMKDGGVLKRLGWLAVGLTLLVVGLAIA